MVTSLLAGQARLKSSLIASAGQNGTDSLSVIITSFEEMQCGLLRVALFQFARKYGRALLAIKTIAPAQRGVGEAGKEAVSSVEFTLHPMLR